ncbi:TolC family protein [bacterium]|nr:TolC family protein [bacterium]
MRLQLCIYILILLFPKISMSTALPSLDLASYIKKNLLVNEDILQADIRKLISQEKKNRASDVFQNSLTLQPGFYNRDFSSEAGPGFHEERTSVYGLFTQRLPTGSVIGAESTYFLNDVNPTVGGGMNQDYRFYIEQPLWRNSFGSLWRRQQDSANAEVEQMSFSVQATLVDSCITSAENFITAYVSQEESRLYKEAYEVAEKAQQIAQNGYAKSFLRKIDYLNSQSDFLKVKTDTLRTEADFKQKLNTLRVQSEDENLVQKLNSPQNFFEKTPLVTQMQKEQIYKLQSLNSQVEAQKQQYYAEKNRNRSAVNLGAETRTVKSVSVVSGSGIVDTQQDISQIYLRLELPIVNKSMRADVATAYNNWQLSEYEKQKQEKLIVDQFYQNLTQFKNREEQLKIAQENIKIKKSQLQEGQKLLKIGRIEFNEYIIYRDSLLNEELGLLRVQAALWQLKARLAQYDSTFLNQCKETLL